MSASKEEISPGDDTLALVEGSSPRFAHYILSGAFRLGANLKNDDPLAPYIEWKPMNREPEPWVALVKARLAAHYLAGQSIDSILFVPSSCTWEREHWMQYGAFPDAQYPRVLRPEQVPNDETETSWQEHQVRSYTRNKRPDGTRGTDTMLFEEIQDGYGQTVLVVEDVVAEGSTLLDVGRILKAEFGVQRVVAIITMAKRMQLGIRRLQVSEDIDGIIIPIVVDRVDVESGQISVEREPAVEIKR